jgi:hypothetical protein
MLRVVDGACVVVCEGVVVIEAVVVTAVVVFDTKLKKFYE